MIIPWVGEKDKTTKMSYCPWDKWNPTTKVWDVREQASLKICQKIP